MMWLRRLAKQRTRRPAAKPPTPRQVSGRAAEILARNALRTQGYVLEAMNVRYPVGELDVIGRQGGVLCVIEVRCKTSAHRFGTPLESITAAKRRHLIQASRWYLAARKPAWHGPVRFDVVAVTQHPTGRQEVKIIQGAFTADDVWTGW